MKKRLIMLLASLVIAAVFSTAAIPSAQVYAASSGWQQDSEGWWYRNPNGSYPTSAWKKIGGYWYYFNYKGYVITGWQKFGSDWYYFYSSGEMAASTTIDGYWIDKNGVATVPGWYWGAGGWWYQNSDGTYPASKWQQIKGKWYHFNSSGYLDTGWYKSGGKYYYLQADGSMATDMWIGNYYVDKDGVWTDTKGTSSSSASDGWVYKNGNWYYYMNGTTFKGWMQASGGNWYYFNSDGTMATDKYVDGWYITKTGKANSATATAKSIVDSNGGTLRAAYDYSSSLSYSGRTEYVESWGSGALANQGFNNGTGNCYVMAATFYCQALCLGYEAHQIAGYVPSIHGGLTPHSWVEIDESDGTWVYDPNRTMESGVDSYHKYYTEPGTWVYSNYHRMN